MTTAASSARLSASAARRASPSRKRLRLESARPSAARTVSTTSTAVGMFEVEHHALHEEHLLRVLLAEDDVLRPHDVEQLGDDGEHAVEVAGAGTALEEPGDRAAGHLDLGARRPDTSRRPSARRRCRRRGRRAGRGRRRGRAGTSRDPRSAPNCGGFTKIETTTVSPSSARPVDEGEVALVQGAQRRHERDVDRMPASASRRAAIVSTTTGLLTVPPRRPLRPRSPDRS